MAADQRCFNMPTEFKTVHNRHLHVADDQINSLVMNDRNSIFSILGGENTVFVLEYFLDELLKIDVIFHNEKVLSTFLKGNIGGGFHIYSCLLLYVNLIFSYVHVIEVLFASFYDCCLFYTVRFLQMFVAQP